MFIVILYSSVYRKCTVLFFGGISVRLPVRTERLSFILGKYWKFFNKSRKDLGELENGTPEKMIKVCCICFSRLFWNSQYFIEFYDTNINLEPKFICPGGGNVAFKKQELTFFQMIEILPFPAQVLQCLLLKPSILGYKILYLLLLESTLVRSQDVNVSDVNTQLFYVRETSIFIWPRALLCILKFSAVICKNYG